MKPETRHKVRRTLATAAAPIPGELAKAGNGCSLPSSSAADAFIRHEEGSLGKLALSTLLRSALIAPGMMLVGVPWRQALVGSVVSSASISTFILVYMTMAKKGDEKRVGGAPARLRPQRLQPVRGVPMRRR